MSEVNVVLGIEIDGQKIPMTEAAAKELFEKLKSIFEGKTQLQYIPWSYPVYIDRPVYVNPPWYVLTYYPPVMYGNGTAVPSTITITGYTGAYGSGSSNAISVDPNYEANCDAMGIPR